MSNPTIIPAAPGFYFLKYCAYGSIGPDREGKYGFVYRQPIIAWHWCNHSDGVSALTPAGLLYLDEADARPDEFACVAVEMPDGSTVDYEDEGIDYHTREEWFANCEQSARKHYEEKYTRVRGASGSGSDAP